MRYLLDTNVLSEGLRPAPNEMVMARLKENRAVVATASAVVHELVYGVARLPPGHRRDEVQSYVRTLLNSSLPVLPYDEPAAAWHGRHRAEAERAGQAVGFADGVIAATAAVNDLTVVSRDTSRFAALGVSVEDWWAMSDR